MSTRPFDGVLCRWSPHAMDDLDLAYGLSAGTLARTAFSPARLHSATIGAQTDEQWRTAVADDLAEACGSAQRARDLVAEWSAAIGEVDTVVAARARHPGDQCDHEAGSRP